MHALNLCTKAELACGGVHPDRTRAHVPVTLVVPPATLAQAHDMPQYPLYQTLTSMRVRGGSAEDPWVDKRKKLEPKVVTVPNPMCHPTEVADQVVQMSDSNGCRLCAVN
jgi:hypothetical protein